MKKKVIQVPIDEVLLRRLNEISRESGRARAQLIRDACRRYVRHIEAEEMDKRYQRGYQENPETPAMGETQAAVAGEVLEEESW